MGENSHADGYYKVYEEYSKTLRTWFVAYGIGAPVLLLNNSALNKSVLSTGSAPALAAQFLIGVALQVLLAAVNKAAAWVLYAEFEEMSADESSIAQTPRHRKWYQHWADWITEQFWIDLVVDIATAILFIRGTYRIFELASSSG